MAKFKYTAVTPDGSTVSGVEEAFTLHQVNLALIERELRPVEVAKKRDILRFEITKKKLPRKELMHFSRQLAVFLRAGIPLLDGLATIAEDAGSKVLQRTLYEMVDDLRNGATFAEAAEKHDYAFPPMYLGIVRSAELTGNLDVVLDQLADYIERDTDARQKVSSALMYPAVVLALSLVSVVVMVSYVLPKFTDFFESLDAELPLTTRMIIAVGNFFESWWWTVAVAVGSVALILLLTLRTERGKVWRDRALLRIPGLGGVVRFAVLERFCRVLSSMVGAGVPLPDALAVTSDATSNRVYRNGLATARAAMMRGEGLAAPLSATGLFPPAARQMFRVGEETGTLDQQMATAATFFDRELDYRLKRFTALFEPAVIIVAGGLVGFIAIALVSAMYGIFRQVNL